MLSAKPWKAESIIRLILSLLVCFSVGSVIVAMMHRGGAETRPLSIGQMVVAALSFQGAVLVLVTRFLRETGTTWREAFGLRQQWHRALLFGFICASLFLPVGWGLQWVSADLMLLFPKLHLQPQEQQAVQTLHTAVTWEHRLLLGLITILLAPVAEEVLFRGILYPWLKQAGFPRLALWGTAILFAAIHFNLATFIPLAALALMLALLYDRMDNLLAPITAHAIFNAANFAMLYSLQDKLLQSP
jgi:membrane protease YdiL (CAAX protease family)